MARLQVFVLEDDPTRIAWFWEVFGQLPVDLTVSTSVDDAVKQFASRDDWGLVSLDHDLGGQTYVSSDDPNTGAEFVRQMVDRLAKVPVVAVHSYNQAGAQRMLRQMEDAGMEVDWTPFRSPGHLSRIAKTVNV